VCTVTPSCTASTSTWIARVAVTARTRPSTVQPKDGAAAGEGTPRFAARAVAARVRFEGAAQAEFTTAARGGRVERLVGMGRWGGHHVLPPWSSGVDARERTSTEGRCFGAHRKQSWRGGRGGRGGNLRRCRVGSRAAQECFDVILNHQCTEPKPLCVSGWPGAFAASPSCQDYARIAMIRVHAPYVIRWPSTLASPSYVQPSDAHEQITDNNEKRCCSTQRAPGFPNLAQWTARDDAQSR
jgi:hypothetical protein